MAGRWALFERWLASVKRIVARLTDRANLLGVARSFSFFVASYIKVRSSCVRSSNEEETEIIEVIF